MLQIKINANDFIIFLINFLKFPAFIPEILHRRFSTGVYSDDYIYKLTNVINF